MRSNPTDKLMKLIIGEHSVDYLVLLVLICA